MKVIFYPPHSNSNDYVNLATKALEENGCQIINKTWDGDIKLIFRSLLSAVIEKDIVFHFNWLEDNAARRGLGSYVKCKLILLFMRLFHLFGGNIVWTMHNARSHNEVSSRQKKFINSFLKLTGLVIVHCSESAKILEKDFKYPQDKVLFVPHGNYCTSIDPYLHNYSRTGLKIKFLYFGAISPYKGVLHLINAFKCAYLQENAELFIYGKPNSEKLREEVENAAKEIRNIKCELRFLTDQELGEALSTCDVTVLPYEKESMQNSGSAIMSISAGKATIIPLFGYIKDIKNKEFVITYDYDNEIEQVDNLRKTMISFCEKSKDNSNYARYLGEKAREFAVSELDWNYIMSKVTEKYRKL